MSKPAVAVANEHPSADAWPALPLEEWRETYETLHRWMQIVGKTRLALAPMQNHWWHVPLYVTARGLGTSLMPCGDCDMEIELDFIDHVLVARSATGVTRMMPLEAQSVARFYHEYRSLLRAFGVVPTIWPVPVELPDVLPFPADEVHRSYDPDAAQRCWRILLQVDRVLKRFRGDFLGKSSPSHFWWGSFDLACTRFSGRRAPRHPGGVPNLPDYVTVEAYSHECISAGWWPGTPGGPVSGPAFYAYAYPEPPGCGDAHVGPSGVRYDRALREWIVPYDEVRNSSDPDASLLEFLESTYRAAAALGGWDRTNLGRS